MPRAVKPRPPEQRTAANERYRESNASIGIAKLTVLVPTNRISELRAITVAWRQQARLLLEADLPSADQILQIHSVSRTLELALPVKAFETRGGAAQWLLAHGPVLGAIRAREPCRRFPR